VIRRLRAVLSIAVLWALAWLPIGGVLALYASSRPPQPSDLISRPVSMPLFLTVWTIWGGLSGSLFAVVLGVGERRRGLSDLSVARTAAWGALGSMTVPAALLALDMIRAPISLRLYDWRVPLLALSLSALLGAGCAAATLALAQRPTH